MHRSIRLALRGLMVSIVVALVSFVIGSTAPKYSPYLSSLSPLAGWKCTNIPQSCSDQMCV